MVRPHLRRVGSSRPDDRSRNTVGVHAQMKTCPFCSSEHTDPLSKTCSGCGAPVISDSGEIRKGYGIYGLTLENEKFLGTLKVSRDQFIQILQVVRVGFINGNPPTLVTNMGIFSLRPFIGIRVYDNTAARTGW